MAKRKRWDDASYETPETPTVRDAVAFANEAVWVCINKHTGFRSRVNGALAEILTKYPTDYELRGPYCWTPFED